MSHLWSYLSGPDFASFLQSRGVWLILAAMLVSLVAVWFEMRLPLRYYWGLPGQALKSSLTRLHLQPTPPVWGHCYIQGSDQPLPVVACELLDPHSQKPVQKTYSNGKGEYGFTLQPGRYLLKATKTRYALPSFYDPENVEVIEVDASFVISVTVINHQIAPNLDIPLVASKPINKLSASESAAHYLRMGLFQLATVLLVLNTGLSLLGWAVTKQPFYLLILAVTVVLLVIKLTVLETIYRVSGEQHA